MKAKYVAIIIFSFCSSLTFSQKSNIDYNQFIRETQKNISESQKVHIVWWIPFEFWEITLYRNNSLKKEQIIDFLDELKPYSIFAVVDAEIGSSGEFKFNPVDSISKSISLIDNDKISYKPIEFKELDSDVQELLSLMKPMLKNGMGQLGENMNFFVFTDEKKGNKRVSDPNVKGNVQLNIIDKEYVWRTPLGSLLPLKMCPKDRELMNGAWEYCPWDGEKLIAN